MKINYKKIFTVFMCVLAGIYGLFLLAPYILSPVLNKYIPQIEQIAKDNGIDLKTDGLKIITTPKFTVGLRAENISVKDVGSITNSGIDVKLIPLLRKKIEFGKIYAANIDISPVLNKEGKLEILELFKQQEGAEPAQMPFGLKYSDDMPNINVNNYKFGLNGVYYVEGQDFKVSDFVLNKKLKLSTNGKITLDKDALSSYDVKFIYGKRPSVKITLRSNEKFSNIVKIANKVAQSFGIKDLETLSATGSLDADFEINSDLKTVTSSGYLKILPSSVKYGLYGVSAEKITADIDLADNNINIKDAGFLIFGHPLKLKGGITQNAVADLKLTGDNLSIKSLVVALGQASLLKENRIDSGTISISAVVKGKLAEIIPDVNIDVNNFSVYNIPMKLKLSVPIAKITADMESINIKNSYALIEKTRIDVTGSIKNYLKNRLDMNIRAKLNGVYADLTGAVTNLEKPELNLNFTVPQNISLPIPYMPNSNITGTGTVDIKGTPEKPKLRGEVALTDISIKDLNFSLTNTVLDFDGSGIAGNAAAKGVKFDNIIGSDIRSKFALENFNIFSLKNLDSTFWGGKITGEIYYNIAKSEVKVDVKGKGLNSSDAVFATTAIPKALTGLLDFAAKLTTKGLTDIEMIKNLSGDVNFEVNDGRFVSIGRLENIVQAQNITSISLLKSALSALSTAATVQQTDKFDKITGELTLKNGMANLSNIKVIGALMSYYVKGNYNILPNTANLIILGRLDAKTVAVLGPIGQLSADKLLSYIPKFGASTAQFLKQLTSDPANEDTSLIPALSTGSKDYKDFKVVFNGAVDKASSMRSFKWLSVCDTSQMNIKEDLQNASKAVKENINSQINSTKNTISTVKTNVTNTVNNTAQKAQNEAASAKQTVNDIKNIDTKQTVKNLGNLIKGAAINANKQVETPKAESETPAAEK